MVYNRVKQKRQNINHTDDNMLFVAINSTLHRKVAKTIQDTASPCIYRSLPPPPMFPSLFFEVKCSFTFCQQHMFTPQQHPNPALASNKIRQNPMKKKFNDTHASSQNAGVSTRRQQTKRTLRCKSRSSAQIQPYLHFFSSSTVSKIIYRACCYARPQISNSTVCLND